MASLRVTPRSLSMATLCHQPCTIFLRIPQFLLFAFLYRHMINGSDSFSLRKMSLPFNLIFIFLFLSWAHRCSMKKRTRINLSFSCRRQILHISRLRCLNFGKLKPSLPNETFTCHYLMSFCQSTNSFSLFDVLWFSTSINLLIVSI